MISYLNKLGVVDVYHSISEIYDEKGNVLVNPTDYIYNAPNTTLRNAQVITPFTIETTAPVPSTIHKGTIITIITTEGLEVDYTVKNVGATALRFFEQLEDERLSNIQFKEKAGQLSFVNEGLFTDNNNNMYLVANNFSNISVSQAEIRQMYPQVNKDEDIDLLNKQAKDEVRADFSFDTNFHNLLDYGQLNTLVKLKIGHILERRSQDTLNTDMKFANDYDKLLKSLTNWLYRERNNRNSSQLQELEDKSVLDLTYEVGV